jgi:predicted membrane protein
VPRRITACSILGRSNVNLTRSQFVHGTTNVYTTAVLGGFTLVVPRGVNVLVNGMSILGKFKNAPNAGKTVDPNRPTVKVHGISILGRARVLVDHKCPEVRVIRRPAPPVY